MLERIREFLRSHRRVLLASAGIAVFLLLALGARFATQVHALRAHRASGPGWSFPSRVYSDGVTFHTGRLLPPEYLVSQLRVRGYRQVGGPAASPGTFARTASGFRIALRGFPDESDPEGSGGPEIVGLTIRDAHLAHVDRLGGVPGAPAPDLDHPPRLEPVLVSVLFDEQRVWRTWVALERIPEPVRDAILSAEDRRFFGHAGLDVRATLRALFTNLREGGIKEGGSTITQQLARTLFLGRRRTFTRKLAEVPLALGLTVLVSKKDVLEMYLNSVYWGQAEGFGIGGVQQAARWYFDAPVESLGVLEGATLAAIIPAPNDLDPFRSPEAVRRRRNKVLGDMVETRRLEPDEAERLRRLPLRVRRGRTPVERFPSYTGYVKQALDRPGTRHLATASGLSIFTTMDLAWQEQAERLLAAGLGGLDARMGRRQLEGAFVALDPLTCAVRAMVGGRTPGAGDYNRAYQARRQTGSAIKPIVYATAFASGMSLTPATTVPDSARTFGRGRHAWRPRNFDGSQHQQVTLAKALEKSLNIATANLVEMIGPGEVARTAERFGLGRMKAVPSIGLGTGETTLLDMTNAFAAFGNRGMVRQPSPIRAVMDYTGRRLLEPPQGSRQAIPEGIAALMTGLMENVVRYGVGAPLRTVYGFDRPVAGKTGTTNDFRDAWFVGFTPDVVAGIWVGYDRPRSIGRQAAHSALPIWARILGRLLVGFPPTPFPTRDRLEWRDINPWTGLLADSTCSAQNEPFLFGTAPTAWCSGSMWDYYGSEHADSLYQPYGVGYGEDYGLDSAWVVSRTETLESVVRDTVTLFEEDVPEEDVPEEDPRFEIARPETLREVVRDTLPPRPP